MLPAALAIKAGTPRNHPPPPKLVLEFVGDHLRHAENGLESFSSSKEFAERTQNDEQATTHNGFKYGYVLTGKLTVEVDGTAYALQAGDLISYSSRRPHRIWNHSEVKIRTLWFNLSRD
jgi:quercetin dioxygenase-like cupin family protein